MKGFSIGAPHEEEALAMFQLIDANGDGIISHQELMAGLSDDGVTDADIECLSLMLDLDGNGEISLQEYLNGYQQARHLTELFRKRRVLLELADHQMPVARRAEIELTEQRATTIGQLRSLATLIQWVLERRELIDNNSYSATNGQRIVWEIANMYHICNEIIMPLTAKPCECSWVEMVAEQAQEPVWFVSHAWLTCLKQTLELLNWHVEVHKLSMDTPYWICTLANNQHDLGELGGSVEQTPFWRAIISNSCLGVVQVMDDCCTPHKRVWCILEIYVVKIRLEKRFEVLAMIGEGTQPWPVWAKDTENWVHEYVAAGPALQDSSGVAHCKPERGVFPWSVAKEGARVEIQKCKASRVEDKHSIMRIIAQIDDPDCEPPAQHPRYEELNSSVRSLFRGSAMYRHAADGNVEELAKMLKESSQGIDHVDFNGGTPVCIAAEYGHYEAFELLAKHRADLNKPRKDGATPMIMAACFGRYEVVKTLISLRADLDHRMSVESRHSPLTIAANQGKVEVYELLLDNGADPSYKALACDEVPFVTAGGTAEEIMQEQ